MAKATIYDIAEKSGFSVATVSKVLNNYKGVNAKTVEHVLEVSRSLNYTPNSIAQSLATKKSRLVGIVYGVSFGAMHPHLQDILSSFKEVIENHGYDVMYINNKNNVHSSSYLEHCIYRQVEGVLVAVPRAAYSTVEALINSSLPCVSVEDIYDNAPSVISDNRAGTIQMLEHLYSLGHRKIGYIAGPLDTTAGGERYDAYIEFMRSRGLEINEKHVAVADEFSIKDGYVATNRLLSKCANDMPTAIFCAYDELAYTTVETLTERGFRVPSDISVAGFDDIVISQCSSPKITTIAQNRRAIGESAAQILLKMMSDDDYAPENQTRIPTSLVVRSSTKKYRTK